MKYLLLSLCLFFVFFFSCAENDGSFKDTSNLPDISPITSATYSVTFNSNWNATDFPTSYPANASFSNTLIMTHNYKAKLFTLGKIASAGINSMATTGDDALLKNELTEFQSAGNANWYDMGIQNPSSSNVSFILTMSSTQPLVSLCMKMIPSPNWFLSISDFSLLQTDGKWIPTATVSVIVYDNDGSTNTDTTYTSPYIANSAGVITKINPNVLNPTTDGKVIGTVTFNKL